MRIVEQKSVRIYPADLELALQQQFFSDQDVRRRQELAIAHMQAEAMPEPEAEGVMTPPPSAAIE